MTETLINVIQLLSLTLMGFISFVLKMLWADMKQMRNELTILQTEHNLMMKCKDHIQHTE